MVRKNKTNLSMFRDDLNATDGGTPEVPVIKGASGQRLQIMDPPETTGSQQATLHVRTNKINYKYSEDVLIEELKQYIDSTYKSRDNSHYAKSKVETTEVIIDNGFGYAFCMGNVLKYAQRYGKKDGYNRKDLMKILHYALMALHIHDNESEGDCYIDEKQKTE